MVTTNYVWYRDTVCAETDETGTESVNYVAEPDQFGSVISQENSVGVSTFHFDAIGSTSEITNSAAVVTDQFRYSAFGETVARSGTSFITRTWVGRSGYYADGHGMFYVRHRHYVAHDSRWASMDPLGLPDGLNRYSYVSNSPLSAIDPTGLEQIVLCKDGSIQTIPDGTPEALWCAGRGGVDIVPPKPHKPCVEGFASGSKSGQLCFSNHTISNIRTWGESVPGKGYWNDSSWLTFTASGTVSFDDSVICCCPPRRVGVLFEADYTIDTTIRLYQKKTLVKKVFTPKKIKQVLFITKVISGIGVLINASSIADFVRTSFGDIVKRACKSPVDTLVLKVKGDSIHLDVSIPPGAKPSNNPAHRQTVWPGVLSGKDNKYHLPGFKVGNFCK